MNTRQIGRAYELFIKNFLSSQDNITHVYLWDEIPKRVLLQYNFIGELPDDEYNDINTLIDTGIDIIYITILNECVLVQCKCISDTICIDKLKGFPLWLCAHPDKRGEVYHTSPSISRNIRTIHNLIDTRLFFIYMNSSSQDIDNVNYDSDGLDIQESNTNVLADWNTNYNSVITYFTVHHSRPSADRPLNECKIIKKLGVWYDTCNLLFKKSRGMLNITPLRNKWKTLLNDNQDYLPNNRNKIELLRLAIE